jgi:glycosyltransferase involved in cell wall biosynthesis
VVGNGIREDLFFPRDRIQARSILGLPANGRLIGTAGAITAGRGISDMFKAFIRLAAQDENLWLVYAGPRDSTPTSYRHERIIDLGILPQEKVPLFFSALDVALICNLDSTFGRYCFPQKLYEIIACGTPVVAAAVGEVLSLLQTHPDNLYPAGDDIALTRKIEHHLQHPSPLNILPISWPQWGDQLEAFFRTITVATDIQTVTETE